MLTAGVELALVYVCRQSLGIKHVRISYDKASALFTARVAADRDKTFSSLIDILRRAGLNADEKEDGAAKPVPSCSRHYAEFSHDFIFTAHVRSQYDKFTAAEQDGADKPLPSNDNRHYTEFSQDFIIAASAHYDELTAAEVAANDVVAE